MKTLFLPQRYNLFAPFLRHLYDFAGPICHTYQHQGEQRYGEYAQTATLKRAESYTICRLVGAFERQRGPDLASGFRFYTHRLRPRGQPRVPRCRGGVKRG